jgi:hypothetical protein
VTFDFDGAPVPFRRGMTVAAALWASGYRAWRVTARGGLPRGYYCGTGFCYDCLISIDGRSNLRACQTLARPGLHVASQVGFGEP